MRKLQLQLGQQHPRFLPWWQVAVQAAPDQDLPQREKARLQSAVLVVLLPLLVAVRSGVQRCLPAVLLLLLLLELQVSAALGEPCWQLHLQLPALLQPWELPLRSQHRRQLPSLQLPLSLVPPLQQLPWQQRLKQRQQRCGEGSLCSMARRLKSQRPYGRAQRASSAWRWSLSTRVHQCGRWLACQAEKRWRSSMRQRTWSSALEYLIGRTAAAAWESPIPLETRKRLVLLHCANSSEPLHPSMMRAANIPMSWPQCAAARWRCRLRCWRLLRAGPVSL